MWLWLSILLTFQSMSYGAPSSLGPTYDQEAQIIWKKGYAAIQNSHFQIAVNHLQRLVDRYPSDSNALEAHFLLGKAFLELGKAKEAIAPLKYFILSANTHPASIRARLYLGTAYLDLKEFLNAVSVIEEINHLPSKLKSLDMNQDARLIEIEALLGLKHEARARSAMETAIREMSNKMSRSTQGKTLFLDLNLKVLECNHLPSPDSMNENQLKNQLDRRGTCLLEALLLYRNTLINKDIPSATQATELLSQAFQDYDHSCTTPSLHLNAHELKRSPQQKSAYLGELADLLIQECGKKYNTGLALLNSWKSVLPPITSNLTLKVYHTLKNLSPRNP